MASNVQMCWNKNYIFQLEIFWFLLGKIGWYASGILTTLNPWLSLNHISSNTVNSQSSFLELEIYWRQDSTRNPWSLKCYHHNTARPVSDIFRSGKSGGGVGGGHDISIIIFLDKLGWGCQSTVNMCENVVPVVVAIKIMGLLSNMLGSRYLDFCCRPH